MFRWSNSAGRTSTEYQTGQALGMLLGGLLGKNYRQRGEAKENIADINAMFPGGDSGQAYNPTPITLTSGQPQPQGGLLSGGLTNTSQETPSPLTQPAPSVAESTPAQQPQQPTGFAAVKQGINQNFRQRLQDAAKTMSREDFARAKAGYMQQYSTELADARAQFDKEEMGRQIDAFSAEQDPRKKIALGMKSGLVGKEGAMMLINPDVETKILKAEGGNQVAVGFNRFTGRYVDLKDGKEVAPEKIQEMLAPTMTPYQRESLAVQREGNAIRAAGSGGVNARYVEVPGLGSMTVDQLISAHEKARPKKKVVEDAMGNKTTVDEGNPALFNLLDKIVQGASGSGGNGGGATVDYGQGMQEVTALIGSGKFNRQQIEAAVQQKYGDLAPYIIRDAFPAAQQDNTPNPLAAPNQFDPNELKWGLPNQM